VNDPRFWSNGETVARAMSAFRARRGERTIWAGVRRMKVRTAAEKVIYLPNGQHVKVSVDDSGVATQIEDDGSLHAIARPQPIRLSLRSGLVIPKVSRRARPLPLSVTAAIPRRKP
jgi:hypothetical protein